MRISPVSFGTIMVGRLEQPGKHLSLKDEISLSFPDSSGDGGNSELRNYRFDNKTYCHTRDEHGNYKEDKIPDGTVYNAFKNYAISLDEKYRKKDDIFKTNPNKVVFTEADFYLSPTRKEKRYFLTAATSEDEAKIHKVLSQSLRFLVAKW